MENKAIKQDGYFARVCKCCGAGMNEGYTIESDMTFCSSECLHTRFTPEEYEELHDNGNGDSFWTDWEEKEVLILGGCTFYTGPNYQFPNGFESWMETHHLIVELLTQNSDNEEGLDHLARSQKGMGGAWELGQLLTLKFESINKGKEWNGEWMEAVETFFYSESESRTILNLL